MANDAKFDNRTILNFRSKLAGGGARSNLFECELTFPTGLGIKPGVTEDLRFLIKSAQLPGSNLSTIPVSYRGRTLKLAGDRTYDPWSITVLNDTNFKLRNAFEKWSNYMNRHSDNAGVITPAAYQTDIIVHQLGRGVESNSTNATPIERTVAIPKLKTYRLWGCFPTTVDPIPLSYDQSDTIEEFNVTFEMQYWTTVKISDNPDDTDSIGE